MCKTFRTRIFSQNGRETTMEKIKNIILNRKNREKSPVRFAAQRRTHPRHRKRVLRSEDGPQECMIIIYYIPTSFTEQLLLFRHRK